MIAMETDRLVDDYLRRLDAAAAHLQRSRRAELVAEIREHIETALRQEEEASEVAVRNVLERLGPPEEIVEAAEPLAPVERKAAGPLEIAALLLLFVPFIGSAVGSVLVCVSQAWSRRDKIIGVTLALLPVVLPLLGFALGSASGAEDQVPVEDTRPAGLSESGSDTGLGPIEIFVLWMLGGLPGALYLGWRLRRHPV